MSHIYLIFRDRLWIFFWFGLLVLSLFRWVLVLVFFFFEGGYLFGLLSGERGLSAVKVERMK